MKKVIIFLVFSIVLFLLGLYIQTYFNNFPESTNEIDSNKQTTRDLDKYNMENLFKTKITEGVFKNIDLIQESDDVDIYIFNFSFDPTMTGTTEKTTTGQINIPTINGQNKHPVVLMLRGYVDQESYETGDGTRNAALYFAENGYITVAPDFLGYAGSDTEANNIFEARFQTYTTTLSLIESLYNNSFNEISFNSWDGDNVFIWAHSNGGQIALTTLEVLQKNIPTSLWAPVSKPFPYSILYYTDESDDGGKLIRRELAKFEELYDTDKYSLTEYLERIKAPIQLQQGTNDNAVPAFWSNSLYNILSNQGVNVVYHQHTGADHNMRPRWNDAVKKDLDFFNKHLVK